MTNDAGDIEAVDPAGLEPWAIMDLSTWQSGWMGIAAYSHLTHGFAEMAVGAVDDAVARIYWLGPDFEVHETFRLRFDPARRCVDLLDGMGEEWTFTESVLIPDDEYVDFIPLCSGGNIYPDELLTRMLSLGYQDFEVLMLPDELTRGLDWDHHWHSGPASGSAWRPVDTGTGLGQFRTLESPPEESS